MTPTFEKCFKKDTDCRQTNHTISVQGTQRVFEINYNVIIIVLLNVVQFQKIMRTWKYHVNGSRTGWL